ncbi:crossover junction endodeoxyribonuclease RuvC [bacterium]|nr:crossover junction endodeoxyribonuclease RuvC [bacterium]
MNSIVLGFDPGIKVSGYGIITKDNNAKLTTIDYGIIENTSPDSYPLYLEKIYDKVVQLIKKFKPDNIAVEEPFISRNPNAGLKIGQIVGVVGLVGIKKGLRVFGYSVLAVKQAVTGYGRAEKQQVQDMVKKMLSLDVEFKRVDISDALGVAICCMNSMDWDNRIQDQRGRIPNT